MADSWGTERAGETNVPRFLRDVGSTPAPPESSHWSAVEKRKLFYSLLVIPCIPPHQKTGTHSLRIGACCIFTR